MLSLTTYIKYQYITKVLSNSLYKLTVFLQLIVFHLESMMLHNFVNSQFSLGFSISGAKTTKLQFKLRHQTVLPLCTGYQIHHPARETVGQSFAYTTSCVFRCAGQQGCSIKNSSFCNDGPQGRRMKGYFELSLKVIDGGIAFDTRNQHRSTQIKDICPLKPGRAKHRY